MDIALERDGDTIREGNKGIFIIYDVALLYYTYFPVPTHSLNITSYVSLSNLIVQVIVVILILNFSGVFFRVQREKPSLGFAE